MVVKLQTPIPKEKQPFLNNIHNKQSTIDLWASNLHDNNVKVELAGDRDEDTFIDSPKGFGHC